MAKKGKASPKPKGSASKKNSHKKDDDKQEQVTLEAIQAMSDSDESVPTDKWNDKAKNLQQAIQDGKFNNVLNTLRKRKTDDDDDGGSSSSSDIEEATLDSSSSEDEDDNKKVFQKKEKTEEVDKEQEEEEDENEEESSDDEEHVNKSLAKNNQHNSKALAVVTAELIQSHAHLAWAETFDIIPPTPLPFGKRKKQQQQDADDETTPVDIHDDLRREVAFYNSALEAVHLAREECKKANVPFKRPDDFFAEMVKTDDHMAKVKDKLIFETKKMEAVAQRKSNREQKLRSKERQANKTAEKAKRKRDHFEEVQEWANSAARQRGGALADDADDKFLRGGPNKKRMNANKKFGFGGKNGRFKQNSRSSMEDISAYNPRGNFGGMGTKRSASNKGKGGGSGADRKGKRARDANRSRRS